MFTGGGWSDERVEVLKKLWHDGLSASQIAKLLGGVTRNAVIGKVHRLGLSGRATPSKPQRTVFKAPRPPRAESQARPAPVRFAKPQADGATPQFSTTPKPPRMDLVQAVELAGTATVLTLGARMCKWPIGDPAEETFTLCGRRQVVGSYCADHAQVAHQPPAKKKTGAEQLARSLRRYL